MATLTYPDSVPYAKPTDVSNLLGAITYGAIPSQDNNYLTSVIAQATQYFETQTDRRYCPVRYIERIDGTGMPSIIVQNSPILVLNVVQNYINAQLLTVIQGDYSLTTERPTGIIRIPLSYTTSASVQYTQAFFKGNRNVLVDYWAGFGRQVFGETLTTTDNVTYSFANPTLAQTLYEQFGPIISTPPIYRPIVYVNGVQLTNTLYQYESLASGSQYVVAQDKIYYTVNWSAGTITFNSPQAPGTVVTSDYEYYYVPGDVSRAVAKIAAIQILELEGIGLGGSLGQGTSDYQMDGFKATYGKQSAFPWEGIILTWQAEIAATVNKYKRRTPSMTGGFYASGWGSYS
jgi:hypothetical protein